MVSWKKGNPLLWDYTCGDSLAPSYARQSSLEAGYVAKEAEKRKRNHYEHLEKDYNFVPICTETMGTWGAEGLKLLYEISKHTTEETGEKNATSHILQAIGVHIQRANAISISGTLPENSEILDEIYYL